MKAFADNVFIVRKLIVTASILVCYLLYTRLQYSLVTPRWALKTTTGDVYYCLFIKVLFHTHMIL